MSVRPAAWQTCVQETGCGTISRHDGRIVETMVDGVLVEFPSVVDAVRNAVEVQQSVAVREADVPEDCRIVFGVGINPGKVIVEGENIHVDGRDSNTKRIY